MVQIGSEFQASSSAQLACEDRSPPRKAMRVGSGHAFHMVDTLSSSGASSATRSGEISFTLSRQASSETEPPPSPPALAPGAVPTSGGIGRPTVSQGFAGQYDLTWIESPATRPARSQRHVFNGRSLLDFGARKEPTPARRQPTRTLPENDVEVADPHAAFLDLLWPTKAKESGDDRSRVSPVTRRPLVPAHK